MWGGFYLCNYGMPEWYDTRQEDELLTKSTRILTAWGSAFPRKFLSYRINCYRKDRRSSCSSFWIYKDILWFGNRHLQPAYEAYKWLTTCSFETCTLITIRIVVKFLLKWPPLEFHLWACTSCSRSIVAFKLEFWFCRAGACLPRICYLVLEHFITLLLQKRIEVIFHQEDRRIQSWHQK